MRFVKYDGGKTGSESSTSGSSGRPCFGYYTGSDDDRQDGLGESDSDASPLSPIEPWYLQDDFSKDGDVQESSLTERGSPIQTPTSLSKKPLRRSSRLASRCPKRTKFTIEKEKAGGSQIGPSYSKSKQPKIEGMGVTPSVSLIHGKENKVNALCCMLKRLNTKQRRALDAVGFGGLLRLNIDSMPTHLDEWLLSHFLPESRYFVVDGRPKFMVGEGDVADIFGFNRRAILQVTDLFPNNQAREVISSWKILYNIPEGEVLSVDDLKAMLPILHSGCEDFQRICVLYILLSFLTPSPTKQVPLGLLNCLLDVGKIKDYNWSRFVLDHVCMSASRFGRNKSDGEFEGCILILLLTYFENCKLEGIDERVGQPVLEHWSEKNIRKRIERELQIGVFGVGRFKADTVAAELVAASSSTSKFQQICDFVVGNDAVVASDQLQPLKRERKSISGASSSKGSNLEEGIVGKPPLVKAGIHLPLLVRAKYGNISVIHHSGTGSLGKNGGVHETGSIKRQLDYGPPNLDRIYLSKVGSKFSQFQVVKRSDYDDEIADYCLAEGSSFPNYEPLFCDNGEFLIFRCNMRCLEGPDDVSSMVMRTWALLLNDEWGVHQRKMCLDLVERGHMLYTDIDLVGRWMSWIRGTKRSTTSADMFFLPFRMKFHYALIVINFLTKKVLIIESLVESDLSSLHEAVVEIVSGFWTLLKHLDDGRFKEEPSFDYELIHPPWSTEKPDGDSGICVMGMMTKFGGNICELSGFRLDLGMTRNQLKVSICATIVLSSRNIYGTAILGRLPSFITDKVNGRVHPTVEAKKIAAICKTGLWQGSWRRSS